jgi:hypothetical protein
VITFFANNTFYARINYHHGAGPTRRHFAEKCCPFKRNPKSGRLDNCILFRVERSDAVLGYVAATVEDFAHIVASFIAVGQARRGANITGGHDSFVLNDYAAASSAITCCPPCHGFT